MIPLDLFLLAASVRLIAALLTLTYGPPDESWQGPEVAHGLVFGVGVRTWEWAPGAALRSFVHPALLALCVYWPLSLVEAALPSAAFLPLLWLAPRLLHAAATLAGDVATYQLALPLHGPRAARLAVLAQLSNFYSLYAGSRTLSNGLEASLCAAALVLWRATLEAWLQAAAAAGKPPRPPPAPSAAATAAGVLAGLSCALRPTTALYFALAAAAALPRAPPATLLRAAALSGALPAALATVLATAALDSCLYGRPTLPALNFFAANALTPTASLYGTHPASWYLTQGLPLLLGAQLAPLLLSLGTLLQASPSSTAASSAWWAQLEGALIASGMLAALSLVAHKEHRFLLPLLPLLSVHVGHGLACFLGSSTGTGTGTGAGSARSQPPLLPLRRTLLQLAATGSLAPALYLSLLHQRGSVAVVEALALAAGRAPPPARGAMAVHWLTPCHATPLFSHLHYRVGQALGLDCHPAAMLGVQGGGFLEGLCAAGAAGCGAGWLAGSSSGSGSGGGGPVPGLWESKALALAPLALIHSAYGREAGEVLAPWACGGGQGQVALGQEEEVGAYLTSPGLFLREFGGAGRAGSAAAAAAPAARRRLPSHIVLHNVQAEALGVQAWLQGAGFQLRGSFPQGQLQGDAHLHPSQSPQEVRLYQHACWVE